MVISEGAEVLVYFTAPQRQPPEKRVSIAIVEFEEERWEEFKNQIEDGNEKGSTVRLHID